jgi:hypothetical protein
MKNVMQPVFYFFWLRCIVQPLDLHFNLSFQYTIQYVTYISLESSSLLAPAVENSMETLYNLYAFFSSVYFKEHPS